MRHLMALLLCGSLGAAFAARPDCAPFNNAQEYYFGANGTIMAKNEAILYSHPFNDEQMSYLKRVASAFSARGTKVIMLPIPTRSFSFAGQLDQGEVKGTPFEVMNQASYKKEILAAYQNSVRKWASAGFTTIDVMGLMMKAQANGSIPEPYLRQDDHWKPEAAALLAQEVARVARTIPAVRGVLGITPYTSTTSTPPVNYHGWRGGILEKCPAWKPLDETLSGLRIEPKNQSLLDDEIPQVDLIGSSYSVPERNFGFPENLGLALQTSIGNYALTGGATFGSLLDYYGQRQPNDPDPKLLLWEFPMASADFAVNDMRQLLPLLARKATVVEQSGVSLATPTMRLKSTSVKGKTHFVKITFDTYRTRSLTVMLETAKGTETVELRRNFGTPPAVWTLELKDDSPLRQVALKLPGNETGMAKIEILRY